MLAHGSSFLDRTKAQVTKENIDKLVFKIKNCASKDANKNLKRQTREWENIFANHISYKQLISKICKYLIKHNSQKKKKIQIKTGQNIQINISPKKTSKWPTNTLKISSTNHQRNEKSKL